jgi:hypothetical protein
MPKNNLFSPGASMQDVEVCNSVQGLFQYFLMNEIKDDITLTSNSEIDDETINVSSGHGFGSLVPGERIVLWEDNRFTQLIVPSVTDDILTLEQPLDFAFTTAAKVIRGNILMNVNGSATPVDYKMRIQEFTLPIDFSAVILTMQHGSNVPDDGKFGGLPALTKGIYFRKENDLKFNLGNYYTNQDFKDNGGIVEYTAKAPAGTNATDIVFDLKEIFGQVMRIDAKENEIVRSLVRDDISSTAGMAKMTTSLIGSYTSGE